MPGAMMIITKAVPLRIRPSYTAGIGSMYAFALIVAPLIGGAFTDKTTWRWCFWINLPFGGVTFAFILLLYTPPKPIRAIEPGWKAALREFDILGMLFFIPGIICLLLALQMGGSTFPWKNGRIIALFVLFGLFIIGFLVIQVWKQENATVPPRIFKNRNVWGCIFYNIMLAGCYFVVIYFVSYLLCVG